MVTRKSLLPAIGVLALLYGLSSQYAAAAEEMVVDGSAAAARFAAEKEQSRSEMKEYVKVISEQAMKRTLDGLKESVTPVLFVADNESRIHG
ncbi:MAG TPA: hypothetical protein VFV10_01045 [Gammaproteobacteria bacterium]|nr:hypothetical protein [Gammaproteobacteria bacterium]